MRIAIPLSNGLLALHFGHCERFALVDVEPERRVVTNQETHAAPDHAPGLLPAWLAERGVNVILAGGMGQRAQQLFTRQGIEVVIGVPADRPETLVEQYLAGTLASGPNVCDH